MEPLIFKIETQADDSGVRKYEKSLGNVNISSQKASGALKSFTEEIARARDGSDLASSALGAFGKILGSSLAGTGIIIAGKTLIDAFAKIDASVKESEKAVAGAFAGMDKAGKAMSFQEAVGQAKNFESVAENIRRKIKEINDSPLDQMIATITSATEQMDIQATIAENQAREIKRVGAEQELASLKRLQGLDAEGKALELNSRALEKELKGINVVKEAETALAVTRKFQLQADEIRAKLAEERAAKEREASDIRRKNAMDEFQLEIDMQNRKTEAESKSFFEKLERDKQVLEQIKKIEEAEQKLNDLLSERVELEDALLRAKQSQTLREGEIAALAASSGGSLRGPGQRKTSFEIGVENAGKRAYQDEIRKQAERYDEEIAEDFYFDKVMKGEDPRVSKGAIQEEKRRRVEEGERERAKKTFENEAKKETDRAKADLTRNQKEIDKQKGEVAKAKGEKNIGDIHQLLSDNLKEMRTYAFVK